MRDLLILVWALAGGILMAHSGDHADIFLTLVILIILCLCVKAAKKKSWFLIIAGFLLGMAISWIYNQGSLDNNKYYVNASFVSKVGINEVFQVNGRRLLVKQYDVDFNERPYEGTLFVNERVRLEGSFKEIPYDLNGNLFHGEKVRLERIDGTHSLLTLLDKGRQKLAEQLKQSLGTEAGSLASSLVLGTRDDSLRSRQDLLKFLGIIHILSISGFHVNLLEELIKKSGLKRMSLPLILGYALLVNSVPAWRAALMKLSRSLGRTFGRDTTGGSQLLFAAFFQLIKAPYLLFSLSFQLTYAATIGLLFFNRPLKELLYKIPGGAVKEGFILSAAAMIPCIPILAGFQPDINLALFPANLLIVPIYSFFCILSFLALPLVMLPFTFPLWVLKPALEWLLSIIRFLEFIVFKFMSLRISWTGASSLYLFTILILLSKQRSSVKQQIVVIVTGGTLLFNLTYLPGTTRISFSKNMGQARLIIQRNLSQYEFVSEKMDKRAVRLTAIPIRSPVKVADVFLYPDPGDFPGVVSKGLPISPSDDLSSDIIDEEYLIIMGHLIRLK